MRLASSVLPVRAPRHCCQRQHQPAHDPGPPSSSDGNFVVLANAGGIHVGDNIPTRVERSAIDDNSAISSDLHDEASSIDAGVLVGASPLTMRDSHVDRNPTATTALTVADVAPVGSALESDGSGTIADTTIVGNVATTFSPTGVASTTGGLGVFDTVLLSEGLQDQPGRGRGAQRHRLSVLGGAVFNTQLTMDHVLISRNTARARRHRAGRCHLERRPTRLE